jgi:di/tricarboxylate transporter
VVAVLLAAGLMVLTRCCTGTVARNSVNVQVLVVIAAALGIGRAMENTGAAAALASSLTSLSGSLPPRGVLFLVFLLTSVFAQLITNNGSAVLVFPIAMELRSAEMSPEPFVLAITIAAACNFMTPIAYQTNLMVYGPGGYKFVDFLRIGVPLTLLTGAITVLLAPIFFPF